MKTNNKNKTRSGACFIGAHQVSVHWESHTEWVTLSEWALTPSESHQVSHTEWVTPSESHRVSTHWESHTEWADTQWAHTKWVTSAEWAYTEWITPSEHTPSESHQVSGRRTRIWSRRARRECCNTTNASCLQAHILKLSQRRTRHSSNTSCLWLDSEGELFSLFPPKQHGVVAVYTTSHHCRVPCNLATAHRV